MIWLLGNKGMLGSSVEEKLIEKRYDYIASDKNVDITKVQELKKFIKDVNIKWIINCVAYTDVDKAEKEKKEAYAINALGVKNIAKLAKKLGATVIHISTDYVFDGISKNAYSERSTTNPINVYGKTKLAGENFLRSILNCHYIIRTSWLYGKNGKNFVNTMLKLMKKKDKLNIVHDQYGAPTSADELAKVLVKIIDKDKKKYGTYHFSGYGKTTWFFIAEQIYIYAKNCGVIKKNIKLRPVSSKTYKQVAKRPQNSYLDTSKIEKVFNITAINWDQALYTFMINYFMENNK